MHISIFHWVIFRSCTHLGLPRKLLKVWYGTEMTLLFIPWLGSSRPWYGPQLAHDLAFEIFRITRLPQSSHVVSNISSAVDVASCRLEQTIVSGTTAVTSQCYAMATPPSKHYGFPDLDTLSDVKSTGKYWLNFVFLTSRDKNKTV